MNRISFSCEDFLSRPFTFIDPWEQRTWEREMISPIDRERKTKWNELGRHSLLLTILMIELVGDLCVSSFDIPIQGSDMFYRKKYCLTHWWMKGRGSTRYSRYIVQSSHCNDQREWSNSRRMFDGRIRTHLMASNQYRILRFMLYSCR